MESGESSMFKSYFFQFDPVMNMAQMKAAAAASGAAGSSVAGIPEEQAVNFAAMAARSAASQKAVDDGSGKLEVWRVEDFKKVEVPPEMVGQFYGGDSYVLLYTYKDKTGREAWIIYFWQGRDSTKDEVGASALLAKELDDAMGGAPVQVRVVQGKEPGHFRSLFKVR